jgi:signal transduction histidine kinase
VNYTFRSQSLYSETLVQHRPICPVHDLDLSALKAQLSTSELVDEINNHAPLIDAWREYVETLKRDPKNLDIILLLCTNHGYLIDLFELGAGKELVSAEVTQLGTNLFHMLATDDLSDQKNEENRANQVAEGSQWNLETHGGQGTQRNLEDLVNIESQQIQSNNSVCVFPVPQDLCTEQATYAVCSPIQLDKPVSKGMLVAITSEDTPAMNLFVQSMSLGIAHACINRMHHHASKLIRNVLLRRLECHMVFLDQNNDIIDEFHATKLEESELNIMHQITRLGESIAAKHAIGDRTYQVDIIRIEDETDQFSSTLGLFRDITRVEQYSDRLQDMEKYSSLVTLSAGIAHEIRNPLTTARGFLQLFLKKSESPSDKQFLSLTITELDRIQSLLHDFMNIAKPYTPGKQSVNLVGIVDEVTQFLCPEASLKNVLLKVELPPEPVYIHADASEIKQVFINILQNAVQACAGTGEVTISMILGDGQVAVEFRDTGCGIKDTSKLFHPFFTTKESGTGLGLVVSKHIIDEHKGTINVESTAGTGTTVRVSLPTPGA